MGGGHQVTNSEDGAGLVGLLPRLSARGLSGVKFVALATCDTLGRTP